MVFTKEWYKTHPHPKGTLGKKHSEEAKRKISLANKGQKGNSHPGINVGDKNGKWKGDEVKYTGLHTWVKRHLPKPDLCQNCKNRLAIDLANVTQQYKRDLLNWKWVCRKCHFLIDKKYHPIDELGKFRTHA